MHKNCLTLKSFDENILHQGVTALWFKAISKAHMTRIKYAVSETCNKITLI